MFKWEYVTKQRPRGREVIEIRVYGEDLPNGFLDFDLYSLEDCARTATDEKYKSNLKAVIEDVKSKIDDRRRLNLSNRPDWKSNTNSGRR